jgi:hypothetical protein
VSVLTNLALQADAMALYPERNRHQIETLPSTAEPESEPWLSTAVKRSLRLDGP